MPYMSKLTKRLAMGRAAFALVFAGVAGCGTDAASPSAASDPNAPESTNPVALRVQPDTASLFVGDTPTLVASETDALGRTVAAPSKLTWSSTDTTVAGVDSLGHLTAVGEGEATVLVRSTRLSSSSRIKVRRAPVASVTIAPEESTLDVGTEVRLTATLRDERSKVLTGRSITWASTDSSIASVDGEGDVTGRLAGSATIIASSEGIGGSASVTVRTVVAVPPPTSEPVKPALVTDLEVASRSDTSVVLRFTEVSDGAGGAANYDMRFAVGPISWGSAVSVVTGSCRTPIGGGTLAAVRTCIIGGLSPGQTYGFQLVTFRGTLMQGAVFGGLSNIASGTTTAPIPTLPPTPEAVATVTVTPATISLIRGQSLTPSITLRATSGTILTGRTVSWSSTNPSVASVTNAGLVTGVAAGTTSIIATSEGRTGTASVSVTTGAPPGTITPWFIEDFSNYTTSSELRTTGGTRSWQSFYIEDQGSIELDRTGGVNIDGHNLAQSMRVGFPDMNTWTNDVRVVNGVQDRCDNYTIRPVLVPNGTAFKTQRHLWFEFYIKFTPNWTTLYPGSWNCPTAGEDHKTWLLLPQGGSGRWQIKIGKGDSQWGPAVFTGDPVNGSDRATNVRTWSTGDPAAIASTYWDGEWHQIRAEVSLGTAGQANGIFRFWLDGVLLNSYMNLTFPSTFTGFSHMEMGANRNHGSDAAMAFNWGLIRIYNQDPGW